VLFLPINAKGDLVFLKVEQVELDN